MDTSPDSSPPIDNKILAALPRRRYKKLFSELQPVTLTLGQMLYEEGSPAKYVYFPNSAMISLIVVREDGLRSIEIGVVGCDGMLNVGALLGKKYAAYQKLVQLPGTALRTSVGVVREAMGSGGPLYDLLHTYIEALLVQFARSAVCNCFHSIDARLARWLLTTQYYARSSQFRMKQEFIAKMLGARRVAITQAANRLQQAGIISYRRGEIKINDKKGLLKLSCNCYAIIRGEFKRLYAECDNSI